MLHSKEKTKAKDEKALDDETFNQIEKKFAQLLREEDIRKKLARWKASE